MNTVLPDVLTTNEATVQPSSEHVRSRLGCLMTVETVVVVGVGYEVMRGKPIAAFIIGALGTAYGLYKGRKIDNQRQDELEPETTGAPSERMFEISQEERQRLYRGHPEDN